MMKHPVPDAPVRSQRGLRRRFRDDPRGFTIVLVAMTLVVIAMMAALAVDVGLWYNRSSKAQRAADSAALSAITEYVKQRKAGANVTNSQNAARTVANSIAKLNGFDPAVSGYTVTTTFSVGAGGADHVVVQVKQTNVPLFFSKMFTNNVSVTRSAEATMSNCAAVCNQKLMVTSNLGTMINTGTGGDGWQAVMAGRYVFNLYHHDTGAVLMCIDKVRNAACTRPSGGTYPLQPYNDIRTNYTPKLGAVGTRVYFVVQSASASGLGCWDGATGLACTGFTSTKLIENYKANGNNQTTTRFDGPEVIGTKLWMYGDNNKMYCYDTVTDAFCTGYPKSTSLAGAHDMKLANAAQGFTGGVDTNGVQFDMVVHPDGRIYTVLGPTLADDKNWMSCWDTTTGASCSGWTDTAIVKGRIYLFFAYDTGGVINGVCARTGKASAGGSGHECRTLTGGAKANQVTIAFDGNSGEQEATAVNTLGQTVTFYPDNGGDSAGCWNWNLNSACPILSSNWDSTADYAYTYDGDGCMIGLGHEGYMWTFSVDTGQWPCRGGPGGGFTRFLPCPCADTAQKRWTMLSLNNVTELDDFTQFRVVIRLPDGTVWYDSDLTQTGATTIDLRLLNSMGTVPAYIDVEVTAQVVEGRENEVFNLEVNGMGQMSGVVPTLVN